MAKCKKIYFDTANIVITIYYKMEKYHAANPMSSEMLQ